MINENTIKIVRDTELSPDEAKMYADKEWEDLRCVNRADERIPDVFATINLADVPMDSLPSVFPNTSPMCTKTTCAKVSNAYTGRLADLLKEVRTKFSDMIASDPGLYFAVSLTGVEETVQTNADAINLSDEYVDEYEELKDAMEYDIFHKFNIACIEVFSDEGYPVYIVK